MMNEDESVYVMEDIIMVHHGEDYDMIPRITVREINDADFLISAIRNEMELRFVALTEMARARGADQYALSLRMIDETRRACELITAISEDVGRNITSTTNTEKD